MFIITENIMKRPVLNSLPRHNRILIKIRNIKAITQDNADIYNQNLNRGKKIQSQELFQRKYIRVLRDKMEDQIL
jgi:hypothetical protein